MHLSMKDKRFLPLSLSLAFFKSMSRRDQIVITCGKEICSLNVYLPVCCYVWFFHVVEADDDDEEEGRRREK